MESARRTLIMIASSFAVAGVVAVVVLTSLDLSDPVEPDLAGGATLTAAMFGAIGLVLALTWTARAGDRSPEPQRLLVGFIMRVAIAELAVMMGILGLVMTGSASAPYVGLSFFLASLFVLYLGLRRVSENVT
ncbi:MAG: hypothetical protein GY722_27895 [bacterium]|nr:hypothetical protein [bacterium]